MITFSFIFRKCTTATDGLVPVCVRLNQHRNPSYLTTKIKVDPKDWDDKKKRVKKSCVLFAHYNLLLDRLEATARELIVESYSRPMTVKEFADKLFHKEPPPPKQTKQICFIEFAEKELLNYKQYNTHKKIKSQIKNLKDYLEIMKIKSLNFKDINRNFLSKYEYYLFYEKKQVLKQNSIASNLSMIARMVNAAKNDGLETGDNVRKLIKIKRIKGKKEFVTLYELSILENLLYSNTLIPDLHKALQIFIFNCYTGLRIQDLLSLTSENFKTYMIEGTKNTIIDGNQTKTNKPFLIPLIEKAYKIYMQFPSTTKQIFDVFKGDELNKKIKLVMKIAKINRNFSISCARTSCASILAELNTPINIIAAILGDNVQTVIDNYIKESPMQLVYYSCNFGR